MPELLAGSPWTVFSAGEKVFTQTFTIGADTKTGINHAVAEINAALLAASNISRLSEVNATTGFSRVLQMDGLHNPEDCPHVRLVTGEALQQAYEAYGDTDHGTGRYDLLLVSYLTQDGAETGDAAQGDSLAQQAELWTTALGRALRRRGTNGVWGYAGETLIDLNLSLVRIGTFAVEEDGEARGARLEHRIRIEQDVFY